VYVSRGTELEFPEFYFPCFSPEAEAELEIAGFVNFEIEASFVREKQVIESIGYGVVKERRDAEESLRDQEDSLHQDLELEVLAEIDSGKITHRKHQDNEVSDRRIASDPKVLR